MGGSGWHSFACFVVGFAAALALAVALTACSVSPTVTAYAPQAWTDSNGVQYVIVTTGHGDVAITPRLAPDGSVMVDAGR